MREPIIDKSSKILKTTVGDDTEIRENCTIHDSEIGEKCRIYERVSIKKSDIGNNIDINAGTYIEFVNIFDGVQIGPNCSIVGISHQLSEKGAERKNSLKAVVVLERAFIGADCVIKPGITIGRGAVIAAGTVVTKDIPDFHICLGIPPNQKIRTLKEHLNRD